MHKYKVSSKVVSAAWTRDGLHIALGQYNGHVSIRDRQVRRSFPCRQPSLRFVSRATRRPGSNAVSRSGVYNGPRCPARGYRRSSSDAGTRRCRSGRSTASRSARTAHWVRLYAHHVGLYGRARRYHLYDGRTGFDPCCIDYFCDGEFLLVAGSNHEVSLLNREGVYLAPVATAANWIWTCRQRPTTKQVAFASNGGVCDTRNDPSVSPTSDRRPCQASWNSTRSCSTRCTACTRTGTRTATR